MVDYGFPFGGGVFMCIFFLLVTVLTHIPHSVFAGGRELIIRELREMGPMSQPEIRIASVFVMTALLWITRSSIDLGGLVLPGWANLLGIEDFVDDGTAAVFMACLLFLIPSGEPKRGLLMDWETAVRLPWGILLLFGGGFALADGFRESGLSEVVGSLLQGLAGSPKIVLIVATCTLLTFLTEVTSNTATTQITLPILAALSVATGIPPLLLMIPAAISASCAFMLPVATPPNAIVFSSGRVTIPQMAKAGLLMNFIGIILVTILVLTLGRVVFGL